MSIKLVVSIVHSDDADQLMAALRDGGFSSTKISTTGGFLREGNATILVGTEEVNVPRVMDVIKRNVTRAPVRQSPAAGDGAGRTVHAQSGGSAGGWRGHLCAGCRALYPLLSAAPPLANRVSDSGAQRRQGRYALWPAARPLLFSKGAPWPLRTSISHAALKRRSPHWPDIWPHPRNWR